MEEYNPYIMHILDHRCQTDVNIGSYRIECNILIFLDIIAAIIAQSISASSITSEALVLIATSSTISGCVSPYSA